MSAWESAGESDEWYTPKSVFDALGCQFDLDVAHPHTSKAITPSNGYLWANSLEAQWFGFVWMNAPFGSRNGLVPWLDKFFAHGDGIALTPDRTSAPWFQSAWPQADAVMFTNGKPKFIRPDGTEGRSPGHGVALWAVGPRGVAALQTAAAKGFGILALSTPSTLAEIATLNEGEPSPRPDER